MSTPPLPPGLADTQQNQCANALHSFAIRLLRQASMVDQHSGINSERLSILSVLVFVGDQTISQLAAIESVSAAAVSRIITALENADLVTRTRSKQDARVVTVGATQKGEKLMQTARKRRVKTVAEQISAFTERDYTTLLKLIHRVAGT